MQPSSYNPSPREGYRVYIRTAIAQDFAQNQRVALGWHRWGGKEIGEPSDLLNESPAAAHRPS
ncbi:MAG: hypothetical protein NW220_12565 [Leptolyngbyaceae cyanobacterium bins.349]|nr:hypothetical protein [Leptolyngbyaceae cyanobacterium bins.349]